MTDLPAGPDVPPGPDLPDVAEAVAPAPPTPVALDDDAAVVAFADLDEIAAAGLEALLFLADEPLDALELGELLDLDPAHVDAACQGLAVRHRRERRGTEVRRAAGGWRMYSAALARPVLERWALTGRTGRLTQAALETLAVVAYKQPISRADIGEIRGVNADGAVRSLVARGLVTEAGRDDGPGQAVLYGTTGTLLERLGLDTLDELPPLTEFLPESGAPDEPAPSELRDARRRLVHGGDGEGLDAPGAAQAAREAATRRFGDVRARLAEAGAEGAAPAAALADDEDLDRDDVLPAPRRTREDRRADEAQMDELTERLESVARSAVGRLRHVVAAAAAREPADEEADDAPDDAPAAGPPADGAIETPTPVVTDAAEPDHPEEHDRG